jgi:hypothetical protein
MIVSASHNYQPPIKCPGLSGRPLERKQRSILEKASRKSL